METNYIRVIECFNITGRGLMTELQHSQNGIPPNSRLIDSESGEAWIVKKRVLSDTLLIADSETFFDCETEFEHISCSYKTEKDRQAAVDKELNKRKKGIYWYLLIPDSKNLKSNLEIGSLLKV